MKLQETVADYLGTVPSSPALADPLQWDLTRVINSSAQVRYGCKL